MKRYVFKICVWEVSFINKMKSVLGLLLIAMLAVLLIGCNNSKGELRKEEWVQSSLFESGSFSMIGVKNKIGFIYEDKDELRFYPNKAQKYMWHVWLDDQTNAKLTVKAIYQNTNEEVLIIDNQVLGGPNNGADAHLPSLISLPHSGMWKLDTYIDGEYFESIYVKVHE